MAPDCFIPSPRACRSRPHTAHPSNSRSPAAARPRRSRRHDLRAPSRLHLAGQIPDCSIACIIAGALCNAGRGCDIDRFQRQAVAALLSQLHGSRHELRIRSRTVRRFGRELRRPYALSRRSSARRRSQARQHPRHASRLGRQQPPASARRRPRVPCAFPLAGHQHGIRRRSR